VAETWQVPVLATGWTTGSGSNPPLLYRMLADTQCVKIYGQVGYTTTAPGTTQLIFTLPTAYCPAHLMLFSSVYDSHNRVYVPIEITAAGAVQLYNGGSASAGLFIDVELFIGV
jgi:hypothetical protein